MPQTTTKSVQKAGTFFDLHISESETLFPQLM
jgi:hypothetical protein